MSEYVSAVQSQLRQASHLWEKDLRAHDAARLTEKASETARSVADFAFEVITVNNRFAARLRGETLAPAPDGFPVCPEELLNVDSLVSAIHESTESVLQSMGDDEARTVETPNGPQNALGYALFAAIHMFYHLGQVNYVQTTYGDVDMHWF